MSSPPTRPTAELSEPAGHRFIIVIPVADRPRHIQACLDSLSELQRRYPYGDGKMITVLIADDSAEVANVAANREIARRYNMAGLPTIHFSPDEQFACVAALGAGLSRVIGNAPRERFGHKGQGIMRNIAYLKVAEILRDTPDQRTLIWSLDSDQEFCVKVATPEGDREEYAVDYFHALDTIFSCTDAQVLTGKVVGDPPVSPAVMTRNFLDDVSGFLRQTQRNDPMHACRHHAALLRSESDAAYHDMADLFGFTPSSEAYAYRCTLTGPHTEADCFAHFAARLNSFFYGEHPTRVSYYQPQDALASVQAARTVYAGNYVFRPAALKYFIPFASLRLRMSGPTLGRLIRAEIGPRFVSANLPMLHKRTVDSGGQAEFRPGIATSAAVIDMSGEFERQFYGDVMLFSIERLVLDGPLRRPASADFSATLDVVRSEMLAKYNARQSAILDKLAKLEALLNDADGWWNRRAEQATARADLAAFAANVRRNFGTGSTGHVRINASELWAHWRGDLLEAMTRYPDDRQDWERLLCKA